MGKPLTRPFSELVRDCVRRDPELGRLMFADAIGYFNEGDLAMGKATLDDYIFATIGFDALGKALGKSPASLKRMMRNGSNPRISDLFAVIDHLQKAASVEIEVSCKPAKPRGKTTTRKVAREKAVA